MRSVSRFPHSLWRLSAKDQRHFATLPRASSSLILFLETPVKSLRSECLTSIPRFLNVQTQANVQHRDFLFKFHRRDTFLLTYNRQQNALIKFQNRESHGDYFRLPTITIINKKSSAEVKTSPRTAAIKRRIPRQAVHFLHISVTPYNNSLKFAFWRCAMVTPKDLCPAPDILFLPTWQVVSSCTSGL